jgi:integrase
MDAGADPDIHPLLHGFHVESNPFAAVPSKSLAKYNRAVDRTLTETELRAFLHAVKAQPESTVKDVLSLSLLLGGQRISQLVRATPADVDSDEQTITLYDPKGARQQPRPHRLPLTKRAVAIVERRLALRDKNGEALPYVFTNNGSVPVRMETVSNAVTDICKAMLQARSIAAPFTLRDLRRTCETMLARMGVSKDIRAQILSHGLGGVQDRHYDWHSYMPEKRSALERWDARLIELTRKPRKSTNVVPLRARSA